MIILQNFYFRDTKNTHYLDFLDNNTYWWRVKTIDETNLESSWSYANEGEIAFKIDTTSPSEFNLTSPPNNEWLNTNFVTFEWEASSDFGSGLKKYQLYLNEELKEDNISPTEISTTVYIPCGSYSWYIKAIDNTGNERVSSQVWTINIDTIPPNSFNLSSPTNNQWVNTNFVEFAWTAAGDNGEIKKYQLYVNEELKEDNISPTLTSTITYLTEGSYSWYVKAIDNADNFRNSAQVWTVNIDTTPPASFNLSLPLNNQWLNSNNVTFQWTPSADSFSGLSKYQLYINGQLKEDNIPPTQTSTVTYLSEGSYSWYIKAIDTANNQRTSNQTWTVNIEIIPVGETRSMVLPKVLNQAGKDNLTSDNNIITCSLGESIVCISTFASTNYYLYSGFIEAVVYPRTITTLSALPTENEGEVLLSWIAPGADDTVGVCSAYDIRYSVDPLESPGLSEEQFQLCESVSKFSPIPQPQPYGSFQTMTITGLLGGTTYYFAIKARNINYSWSFLSNAATVYVSGVGDSVAPAAITTFSAQPGFYPGEIKLSWISVGDDGLSGNIVNGRYRIRYSTYVLEEPNFWTTSDDQWKDFQNKYQIIWTTNTQPLLPQTFVLTGLKQATTYYIRIWTRDERPNNWSLISNGATSQAQLTILSVTISPTTYYNFGMLNLGVSTVTNSGFTIINSGNVREKYSLRCSTITIGSTWQPSTTSDVDKFLLKAVFHPTKPEINDFGPEDVVLSTYRTASNTIYSVDGSQVGFNVEVNGVRTIWYFLQMPTDTSCAGEQRIRIYIIAEEQ